jgi:hypothetical protein
MDSNLHSPSLAFGVLACRPLHANSGILAIDQLIQQNITVRLTDQATVRQMVRKRIRADVEAFCQR